MTKPTKIHVKKALNDESSNADVNMEVTLQEEDIGSAPSSSNNDTANLQQDSQMSEEKWKEIKKKEKICNKNLSSRCARTQLGRKNQRNNNKDKSYKKTNTNTSTRLYSDTVKNIKKITFGSHSNTPDTSSNKERTQNTQLQQLFSNIESKLKSVQETLNVLTNRINIIEEKIGIKKVISLPNQNQTKNLKTMHNIQHTGLHDISSDESTIHSEEEEINDIKQNKLQETMNDILKEIHSSSTMLFDNHQQETTQKQ
ncbi:19531_t:CDS:2 [Entrophospora sp. SA101]|nr:19531_t:CDS:2 [Entrophospora sp. SA101]